MHARACLSNSSACAFAWLGGVMFAGSLGWFVYFYYNVLGQRPAQPSTFISHLTVDIFLFGAFAFHHSLFARETMKRFVARHIAHLERSVYVWIASLLFIVVCVAWRPVPGGEIYELTSWSAWLGRAVQLSGLLLTARAAGALDALELAGIRQGCGSYSPSSPLRIVGPYRWVRHPLYLGWIVFVFGAAQMSVDRLAFAIISSAYLLIAIPWEERSLSASLGSAYRDYMQSVRWRLVPFVY